VGISGIFMLASAIINGVYQSEVGNVFEKIFRGSGTVNEDDFSDSIFSSTYLLVALLAWLNVVAMRVTLIAYVKVYERKQGEEPEFAEVWAEFSRYFLKVFLYSLLILLVIAVGMVLCILPGVYLWVVLLPFEMVIMVEEETFGNAWDRCFTIVKENFWGSLGIYIVAYLIYNFSTAIIGGAVSVVTGILTYFTTKDLGATFGFFSSILNIFSFVFFIVFYISVIMNYFSLTERYDGTGIIRRLDELGGNTSSNTTEEQY
jgi:hypothetical protein